LIPLDLLGEAEVSKVKTIKIYKKRAALAAVLTIASIMGASAQEIDWKQTVNVPKGQNMPKDVKANVLGIEAGDTYAELKAKLDALAPESIRPTTPPYKEMKTVFRIQTPGAQGMTGAISYVGQIDILRNLKGSGVPTIDDQMSIRLSAPSSGHQVLGLSRVVSYNNEGDQPRVSELLAQLKQKFRSEPQVFENGTLFRFQFRKGQSFVPPNAGALSCQDQYRETSAENLPRINIKGECDVYLDVRIKPGITKDHAHTIFFTLSDNARAKTNLTADFAFFDSYFHNYQENAKGVAPKL
jgi:hypothetical protein